MKILHLTKKYPSAIGGDAVVVFNLQKEQMKSGHEIFIVTSNCPEIKGNVIKFGMKDRSHNLDRITIRRILSLFTLFFWGFKNLKRLRPDIIHSHSADLGFFISIHARLYQIPIVNTCHGITFPYTNYGFIKRYMEKFFLKYGGFKKIIVIDKVSLKLMENAGFKNCYYIQNGIDIDKFYEKNNRINQKVGILFVGRLELQKGLIHLIEAVKLLNTDNFEVSIVGEGSQKEMLNELIKKSDLNERIKLLGRIEDNELDAKYMESDIFVLPSLWEGLPLSLLEAMAAGLPAIVTNVGGIPDICINDQNSLIINPENPAELAKAMKKLIEDKGLRKKLGENSKTLLKHQLSWEASTEKVLKLYEEIS